MDWIEITAMTKEQESETFYFRLEPENEDENPATVKGTFSAYPDATHFATLETIY